MLVVNSRFLTQEITGVQRFSMELSLCLKEFLREDVLFLSPQNIKQKDYAKILNVTVIGKHTGHLWEQFDLPYWLSKNGKPLLLCLANTGPIMYRRKMTVLHDITFLRCPETFSWKFLFFYRLIIPQILKTSMKVFSVSNFSLCEIAMQYGVDKEKMEVIYNAVSSNFLPQIDKELKEEKYILAVSSVKANKNFRTAVEAFIMAQRELPSLKLYVIGDIMSNNFNSMPELVETCKKHTNIKLLGRVSDEELVRYYSNALVFIFPSFYEGFGIPVLEAQACGCPVISSNSSSLPEVLSDSALLCNPNKVEEFTNAIKVVAQDNRLREKLILSGYANVKRFNWRESTTKLVNLLKAFTFLGF